MNNAPSFDAELKNIANKKSEEGKKFVSEKYNLTNTFILYKNLFTKLLEEEDK